MSRVVLVSNRVLDLSKAARAGGVAVVLTNIARTRKALWFGWNGEVKPASEVHAVEREGRIATAPLSDIDYAGYYLGYANSVRGGSWNAPHALPKSVGDALNRLVIE